MVSVVEVDLDWWHLRSPVALPGAPEPLCEHISLHLQLEAVL